jgi:hypothetical protein
MSEQGRADVPPAARAADHPAWLLGLALLLAWQGWLTLGLFGRQQPWQRLLDDGPILSGRHPLHLYHGYLGARALCERGTLSCYDPSFHAGYPKTPVFDSGSRPAELVLALAGGRYRPAAYKIGVALLCACAPLLLFGGARGVGLGRGPSCLACLLGILVWWGKPCQEALTAGDADLLLAALLVLAQAGLLIRYHFAPGPLTLIGVVVTGLLGWFAHPLLLALLLPLFLVYYLSAGTRHRLPWHLPLLGGLLAALAGNAFWLIDWVSYWWIRVPLRIESPLLAHRTLRSFWEAPLWGGLADKVLACVLVGTASVGVVLFNGSCQRATARLLGLGWAGFLLLAALGIAWEPLGRLGAAQLLIPALLFAALPAAHALAWALRHVQSWTGQVALPAGVLVGLLGAAWAVAFAPPGAWEARWRDPLPLEIGLGPERTALVEALQQHTSDEARVLWEDRRGTRLSSRWTALFPLLLPGRSFVGGLDPEAGIEHTLEGLVDQTLAGRALAEWSDAELADYCRRYNVGWVACWSAGARARFGRWPEAQAVATLPGECGEMGQLFRLRRSCSFALSGSVCWRSADAQRILLSNAVPERIGRDGEGQIVLSLHYQAGMRVTPARVRLERAYGPEDAIPFVRLRVSEPVGRVMITWEGR